MDGKDLSTMALSPSDKDNMVAFLGNAFARNKIDIDEYERRLALLNSINSIENIRSLVNDLVIDSKEITEEESVAIKMENRSFSRSTLVTNKLLIEMKYSTIVLDYTDIDFPDGKYEIQLNGEMANITLKVPAQYNIDNQISSHMVTINNSSNEGMTKWKRNVVLKLTGKLKTSEINIINVD